MGFLSYPSARTAYRLIECEYKYPAAETAGKVYLILVGFCLVSCKPEDSKSSLREALTFHASFDDGANADFAKGDKRLFNLVQLKPEPIVKVGLPGEVVIDGAGRFGNCLFFNPPDDVSGTRAFFKLQDNLHFSNSDKQIPISPPPAFIPDWTRMKHCCFIGVILENLTFTAFFGYYKQLNAKPVLLLPVNHQITLFKSPVYSLPPTRPAVALKRVRKTSIPVASRIRKGDH